MPPTTVPSISPDHPALKKELRRRITWIIAAIVVGAAAGLIAAAYLNAGSLVPQPMLSLARRIVGDPMPVSHEQLLGAMFCGEVIVALPVLLVHAWRLVSPALKQA